MMKLLLFIRKLVKSDNIDLVKDHIYDEVITFHKENDNIIE